VIGTKVALATAISMAALLVPRFAVACAVCFTGREDETRIAFIATTVLLSALPLLLIGSLVWWLRRRAHRVRDERERASDIVDGTLRGLSPPSELIANRPSSSLVDLRGE
jgi:hypothetical protein